MKLSKKDKIILQQFKYIEYLKLLNRGTSVKYPPLTKPEAPKYGTWNHLFKRWLDETKYKLEYELEDLVNIVLLNVAWFLIEYYIYKTYGYDTFILYTFWFYIPLVSIFMCAVLDLGLIYATLKKIMWHVKKALADLRIKAYAKRLARVAVEEAAKIAGHLKLPPLAVAFMYENDPQILGTFYETIELVMLRLTLPRIAIFKKDDRYARTYFRAVIAHEYIHYAQMVGKTPLEEYFSTDPLKIESSSGTHIEKNPVEIEATQFSLKWLGKSIFAFEDDIREWGRTANHKLESSRWRTRRRGKKMLCGLDPRKPKTDLYCFKLCYYATYYAHRMTLKLQKNYVKKLRKLGVANDPYMIYATRENLNASYKIAAEATGQEAQ
ncbi:MAG: hypothetical protein NWF09_07470 [Candidatus Bathyarchaeota archaeon]|nr:hypothetical protein [Candidatus Bathyarchaeota archaeon]